MFTETNGAPSPKKVAHLEPGCPFAIHDPQLPHGQRLPPSPDHGLANVAATVFNLLGFEAPENCIASLIGF